MELRDNVLIRDGLRELRRRLPPGWTVGEPSLLPRKPFAKLDALVEVTAPDQRSVAIVIEARVRPDPRAIAAILDAFRAAEIRQPLVVIARYLSPSVQERLRTEHVGFLDLSGNARIVVADPGLYVETRGATADPDRERRSARTLRGPKAGRIVRKLVDLRRMPGVRELAATENVDAGYVSRVLALLDSEALIERASSGSASGSRSGSRSGPRFISTSGSRSGPKSTSRSRSGPITRVDWQALLRRWAQDAPLDARGIVRTYLEPRGFPALLERLARSTERYAITGSLAAAPFMSIAPPRLAIVWLRDAEHAAARLGLRPAESGGNVLVVEPVDESVFDRAVERGGVRFAAPSQVAADLLTSPGRGPAEADALIQWMSANEEVWRG